MARFHFQIETVAQPACIGEGQEVRVKIPDIHRERWIAGRVGFLTAVSQGQAAIADFQSRMRSIVQTLEAG